MLWQWAAAYAAGLVLPWWAAVVVSAALAAAPRRRRFELAAWPALALATVLGGLDRSRPPVPVPELPDAAITGWIASAPEHRIRGTAAWFVVEAAPSSAARAVVGRRVWCEAPNQLPPYGTRIAARGALRPAAPARNFAAADPARALRAAGGVSVLRVQSWTRLGGRRGAAWRRVVLEPLRQRIRAALEAALAPAESGLLAALVMGARDGVDPQLARSWSALGLTHILSISGMHVALVAGALLALFGPPHRGRGALGFCAGIWLYAAIGGFGPTVLRATLMATWAAVATYLGRTRAPLTALGLASLLLVVQAPERRLDLGLQLSCASTAGLLACAPALARFAQKCSRRGRMARILGWVAATAGLSCATQLVTLPLTLRSFGTVAWIAPVANAILVPATDLALVLALVGAPLGMLSESLARAPLLVSGGLLHALAWACAAVTSRWETRWFLPDDARTYAASVLVAAAVFTWGVAASARRGRIAGIAAAAALAGAALLGLCALHPPRPLWELDLLDVGQGDALLLRCEAVTWIVDTGDDTPTDSGARVVLPALRRAGVRRVRGLVLSHPHRDHCGGAASVLAGISVDTVYVGQASFADTAYAALRARFPQVPWRGLARGDTLQLGPRYAARVLWPLRTDTLGGGANECSLVLAAHGGDAPDVWFQGDLEHEGEAQLAGQEALHDAATRFVILKAGHHGSDTSSTAAFIAALQPDIALLSVGAHNRYRHPGRRTLATLEAQRCTILRTDRGGAVRFVLRGTTLWFERPAVRPLALGRPVDASCEGCLE